MESVCCTVLPGEAFYKYQLQGRKNGSPLFNYRSLGSTRGLMHRHTACWHSSWDWLIKIKTIKKQHIWFPTGTRCIAVGECGYLACCLQWSLLVLSERILLCRNKTMHIFFSPLPSEFILWSKRVISQLHLAWVAKIWHTVLLRILLLWRDTMTITTLV